MSGFDIKAFVKSLPGRPGVYRMLDADGTIVYVGKARSLRQRLSNYFQDPRNMHPRTAQMVATVAALEAMNTAMDGNAGVRV